MSPPRLHIAVVAPPTLGHLQPLAAMGAMLQQLGHRVTILHVADLARALEKAPVAFHRIGAGERGPELLDQYLATLARPRGVLGLTRMIRATARMTGRLLEALPEALIQIGADAVIADAAEPAGTLAARHIGLPFVTSATGLPLLAEPGVPPPFVGWAYRADEWGIARNRGGYAVADLLMRPITRTVARYAERWGMGKEEPPLLQVAQCPAALDFPRAALPDTFRYGAPWRLPENAIERPTGDSRPLIFCSLGTLQGSRKRLFAAMTAACAQAGARAVVAHGGGLDPDDVAALPGDALVRAFWPQRAILTHCSAAILHCGFNSVLDALAAGLPIVAVPLAFEQPATAARLVRAGTGISVRPARADAGALRIALTKVLYEPGYRAAARRLQGVMAGRDGAAEAARLVSAALAEETLPPA